MHVIVDDDYLELLMNDEQKPQSGEINPFTGKRCPRASFDEIKKLVSIPKEERQKMIQKIFVRYI